MFRGQLDQYRQSARIGVFDEVTGGVSGLTTRPRTQQVFGDEASTAMRYARDDDQSFVPDYAVAGATGIHTSEIAATQLVV